MVLERTVSNALYGLVLAGGKSTRMGVDKCSLKYYNKSQAAVCFSLLSPFCQKVLFSIRAGQKLPPEIKSAQRITDMDPFAGSGPLAGILSAMETHPGVSWLVLACDLPCLDLQTLQTLIDMRNPQKLATAYKSANDGLPEPLCAIYEPAIRPYLERAFHKKILCPRKILISLKSKVSLLALHDTTALENVNSSEEYARVLPKTFGISLVAKNKLV